MKEGQKKGGGTPGNRLQVITTFCHVDQRCCPQLCLDAGAEKDKEVVITDDFGGSACMSREQLRAFVTKAQNGEIVV